MHEEAGGGNGFGGDGGAGGRDSGLDDRGARILTHVVYGLQAAFPINGITFLLGVILNYAKRSDVQGTLYESHFRHQIGTFWVGVAALAVFLAVGGALFAAATAGDDVPAQVGMPVAVGVTLLALVAVVYLYYRIIRGWLALLEEKPVE